MQKAGIILFKSPFLISEADLIYNVCSTAKIASKLNHTCRNYYDMQLHRKVIVNAEETLPIKAYLEDRKSSFLLKGLEIMNIVGTAG